MLPDKQLDEKDLEKDLDNAKQGPSPMHVLFEMVVLEQYQAMVQVFSPSVMSVLRSEDSPMKPELRRWIRTVTDEALSQEQTLEDEMANRSKSQKQKTPANRPSEVLDKSILVALDKLKLQASTELKVHLEKQLGLLTI